MMQKPCFSLKSPCLSPFTLFPLTTHTPQGRSTVLFQIAPLLLHLRFCFFFRHGCSQPSLPWVMDHQEISGDGDKWHMAWGALLHPYCYQYVPCRHLEHTLKQTMLCTVVSLVSKLTSHQLVLSNQLLTVLGTVLGLVISFRTSSAYERCVWTCVYGASLFIRSQVSRRKEDVVEHRYRVQKSCPNGTHSIGLSIPIVHNTVFEDMDPCTFWPPITRGLWNAPWGHREKDYGESGKSVSCSRVYANILLMATVSKIQGFSVSLKVCFSWYYNTHTNYFCYL